MCTTLNIGALGHSPGLQSEPKTHGCRPCACPSIWVHLVTHLACRVHQKHMAVGWGAPRAGKQPTLQSWWFGTSIISNCGLVHTFGVARPVTDKGKTGIYRSKEGETGTKGSKLRGTGSSCACIHQAASFLEAVCHWKELADLEYGMQACGQQAHTNVRY
jgi:hypothetical protein